MSLVETDWLEKNINNVKIIDCSWHMPQSKRNGFEEYKKQHITNAIFFDLDNNSNKDTDLPHMLVKINDWEKIVSKMGIKNENEIVIYDNSDVISSCRCWFNFIYFGHNPKLIHVLNLEESTLKFIGIEGRKNVIKKFNIEKMCFSTYLEYKKLIN